ncbi:Molybdenum cofactor guanylyltransferase [Gammaproteobacteria bacterium]
MTLSPSSLAAVILAGGLSRRMGRIDKAFATLAGQTLLQRVVNRLLPQVGKVMINTNGDAARFSAFALPVVPDLRSHHPGPLAGIEAAFLASDADWLLSVAVDLPFLPLDLAEKLSASAEAGLVMAAGPSGPHPVVALWSRHLLPAISSTLDQGSPRLLNWIKARKHAVVSFSFLAGEIDPFFNINHPHDLDAAQYLLPS